MNETQVSVIGSLIIAIGGWVTWWVRRRDNSKDPIPRTSAELAIAERALGIIEVSRTAVLEDLDRLKRDRQADHERIRALEHRAAEQENALDKFRALLSQAASFIEVLLRWAHAGSPPPPPDLPPNLYDLIDPALHPRDGEK